MRFLMMMVLVGGCAMDASTTEGDLGTTGTDSTTCSAHKATILSPSADAVLPGTSLDVRIAWAPEPARPDVRIYDPKHPNDNVYQPISDTVDKDGVHVYHFELPAGGNLEVNVYDQCFVGTNNMRALLLHLGSVQFSTGT